MKITFILPHIGMCGGVKVAFEYANRLQERGHEVSVIYPLIPISSVSESPMHTVGRTALSLWHGNRAGWFDLKAKLVRVPALAGKFIPNADIVVATQWETAHYVDKYSRDRGEKFYLIQHYETWCGPKERVDETYKLGLHNIVISNWLKRLLLDKGAEVEAVIPDGVDPNQFYPEPQKHKGIRILMSYRREKWKGIWDGLRAFELVSTKCRDVELVMFGPRKGNDVPEDVEFYENSTTDKLRHIYNSCDIFCFPSWIEGFGLPPTEAMACGVPVVTTNVGAVPDYAINGKTALISQPGNYRALADNMVELIENKQKRKQIAEAGYHHIQQFTWDKSTTQMEQVFYRMLTR